MASKSAAKRVTPPAQIRAGKRGMWAKRELNWKRLRAETWNLSGAEIAEDGGKQRDLRDE
jgi:hypothetical protein